MSSQLSSTQIDDATRIVSWEHIERQAAPAFTEDFPIKITDINKTTIVFHGSSRHAPDATYRQINGGIDRVTGDAEATSDVTSWEESKASAIHWLKCRPTQRMF